MKPFFKRSFAALAGAFFAAAMFAAPLAYAAPETDAPKAPAVANPVKNYAAIPDLQDALGFPILYLPGDLYHNFDPAVAISAIGGRVGDVRFVNQEDGSQLMVRTALRSDSGLDDISGFYGYDWVTTQLDPSDLSTIDICVTDSDTYVARWVAGNFAFAVAMKGTEADGFARIARSFFISSRKFAQRFSNIKTASPK